MANENLGKFAAHVRVTRAEPKRRCLTLARLGIEGIYGVCIQGLFTVDSGDSAER